MPDPSFDAPSTAKTLIRSARRAALGTLSPPQGAPFVSLVTIATAIDGTPILLLSNLAVHAGNLEADARASLLVAADAAPGDPLALARVTIQGSARRIDEPAAAKDRFLRRNSEAEAYVDFGDFAFYRFTVTAAHLVAGFGRIVPLSPADMLIDPALAATFAEVEREAVQHMNEDHRDALSLYAERLAGAEPGDWRSVGADPEGLDLMAAERCVRIGFMEPVRTGAALRSVLKSLAVQARSSRG